jgi:putative FmdB family regulatory protein
MPLYEYSCSICGQNFEKVLPVSYGPLDIRCPSGHRKVHRVYSPPVIMFKGSGFYSTDHRSDTATRKNRS